MFLLDGFIHKWRLCNVKGFMKIHPPLRTLIPVTESSRVSIYLLISVLEQNHTTIIPTQCFLSFVFGDFDWSVGKKLNRFYTSIKTHAYGYLFMISALISQC